MRAVDTDSDAPLYVCPRCTKTTRDLEHVARMYCPGCNLTAEQMRAEVVTELDLTDILPCNWPTRRDCFTASVLTLFQCGNPQALLVHGWVLNSWKDRPGEPKIVQHAWLEVPATGLYEDGSEKPITAVVDFTQIHKNSRVIPLDDYYRAAGVCDIPAPKRYTLADAVRLALAHRHDGPWPDGI